MRLSTLQTNNSWAAAVLMAQSTAAGGPAIMAECNEIRAEQGGCPTGSAVITTAGDLPAKHVIHTVGTDLAGRKTLVNPTSSAGCYRESLRLALEGGIKTVAFPSISTGIYGYPIDKAATTAVNAVKEFLETHDGIEEVRFVLFDDVTYAGYENALS